MQDEENKKKRRRGGRRRDRSQLEVTPSAYPLCFRKEGNLGPSPRSSDIGRGGERDGGGGGEKRISNPFSFTSTCTPSSMLRGER